MNTWKELRDLFYQEAKQYTATIRWSDKDFMFYASDAQAVMQKETSLIETTSIVTFPALTLQINLPYTVAALMSAHSAASPMTTTPYRKKDWAVREYQEMQDLIDNWDGHTYPPDWTNENRFDSGFDIRKTDPSHHIICAFHRMLYIFPPQAVPITLRIHYKPELPQFSTQEPYWANWKGSSPTDDTNFVAQFATQTPEREFGAWQSAIIQYCLWKYLGTSNDAMVMGRANKAHDEFNKAIVSIMEHKPVGTRFSQITYNMG